jgi:hypothetical protein
MAETLNFTRFWEIAGKPNVRGGNLETPIAFTLTTGTPHYVEHTIADAFGKDVLFAASDGGKDTFQFAIIEVDKADQWVEMRDDAGSPNFTLMPLLKDLPNIIPGNLVGTGTATALDAAVLVDNTDYNNIDRLEGYNNTADGVGDALFRVWIFD